VAQVSSGSFKKASPLGVGGGTAAAAAAASDNFVLGGGSSEWLNCLGSDSVGPGKRETKPLWLKIGNSVQSRDI